MHSVSPWCAIIVALGVAACATETTSSSSLLDCPLRDAPYSLHSPLLDILLKPEAMAAIEAASPGFAERVPASLRSGSTPSFAAILSLADVAAALPGANLDELNAALQALPVTDFDRSARCAHYDADTVDLNMPETGVRILVFEKINGFRDGPSVDAARNAFAAMAEQRGWTLRTTDRGGAMTDINLRNVDVVIWNNVSGDALTLTQRAAFRRFIESGGGFVGIHGSGGDPTYFWDWYVDTLIGARFIGHTMSPQFQEARVVLTGDSAIGVDVGPAWTMTDEWYSFATNPRDTGATIVATLDERSYTPGASNGRDLRMGEHPIVWTRCIGNGRAFYSAIGHRPETYRDPHHVALLEEAIVWAAGAGETVCRAGVERGRSPND